MIFVEYAVETILGTLVMTLFSYVMSESFRKLFTEPILINYVIRLSRAEITPRMTSALGWILHFFAGLLFVLPYHWFAENWLATFVGWLILGAISGIVGIVAWMFIFRLAESRPRVAFKEYYGQLFFAHIFFAVAVGFTHRLMQII